MIILFIFLGLLLFVLVAALVVNKKFVVERETFIMANPGDVFGYIRFLKNHYAFSKWVTKEQSKLKPSVGIDGTPGFVQPWVNYAEKAGEGELKLNKIHEGSGIELLHQYIRPTKGLGVSRISIRPHFSGCIVSWEYSGTFPYPLNLLTTILNMDRIIGVDLEKCLNRLDAIFQPNGQLAHDNI